MTVKEVTVGVELELGISDSSGKPVNVLRELGGEVTLGRTYHAITGELSQYSAEFVTPVCTTAGEVRDTLLECQERLPRTMRMVCKTIPFGWPVPLADFEYKPRYPVVREGLGREHPCGFKTLDMVAPFCATQFQIGVDDVNSPAAVLLRNFLDNIAPFADVQVRRRYGVTDATEHLMIWWGWSIKERVPGYRWFVDADDMNAFVGRIPQLVVQDNDGKWVVAHGVRSKIGNPLSEGTIWWLARPRGVYQTVEWRAFPALTIGQTTELAGDVFRMMNEFWAYVAANPGRTWPTPESASDLYQRLSRSFYFVPPAPLSKTEWMTLFVQ